MSKWCVEGDDFQKLHFVVMWCMPFICHVQGYNLALHAKDQETTNLRGQSMAGGGMM